jgi:acyl carrier protein
MGRPSEQPSQTNGQAELVDLIARTEPGLEMEVLVEEVRRRACIVLGLASGHAIDPDRALSDMGLDSLMAIELRNALSAAAGKALPSTLIFSYPSTGALAGYLAAEIQRGPEAESATAAAPQPEEDDFLSRLEQLSDDAVDRMLNEAAGGVL